VRASPNLVAISASEWACPGASSIVRIMALQNIENLISGGLCWIDLRKRLSGCCAFAVWWLFQPRVNFRLLAP